MENNNKFRASLQVRYMRYNVFGKGTREEVMANLAAAAMALLSREDAKKAITLVAEALGEPALAEACCEATDALCLELKRDILGKEGNE